MLAAVTMALRGTDVRRGLHGMRPGLTLWPLCLSLTLHAAVLVWCGWSGRLLPPWPAGALDKPRPATMEVRLLESVPQAAMRPIVLVDDTQVPSLPANPAVEMAPPPMSEPLAQPASATPTSPPEAERETAPVAAALTGQDPAVGYDVAPVPKEGWRLDASALLGLPAGSAAPMARIEFEVDASGQIVHWRLLDTNIDTRTMLAVLDGVQNTLMVPARLAGRAVAVRFEVELAFMD